MAGVAAFAVCAAVFAQTRSRSVWDGVYTKKQAERGHDEYNRRCADCHGDELEGDVVEHPALAGGGFRDKWDGETLDDLFERIHRDMPARNPGSLSRAITAELIAFILSANDYPPGAQELPRESQLLREIRIVAQRPR